MFHPISSSFKLRPERTLFASFFSKASTNSSSISSTFDQDVQQFCGHSGGLRLERHSSLADLGCLAYPEGRAVPFLSQALALGRSRDYGAHSDLRMKDRKRNKAGTEVSEEQVILSIFTLQLRLIPANQRRNIYYNLKDGSESGSDEDVEEEEIAQIFLSNRGPQQDPPSDGKINILFEMWEIKYFSF